MTRRILIVFPKREQDLADNIEETLQENFALAEGELLIDQVKNEQGAKNRLLDDTVAYDLVIIHLYLPADRKIPLNEEEQRGLKLLRWLDSQKPSIAGLLLDPSGATEISLAVQEIPRCKWVPLDFEDWEKLLIKYAGKALGAASPALQVDRAQNLGDVEITLNLTGKTWTYLLKETEGPYNAPGVLEIDAEELERLIKESAYVNKLNSYSWEEKFREIGFILKKQIFLKNSVFFQRFGILEKKVGGKENIRIRFVVEKEIHPIALEALLEEPGNKYWMNHAPIYRRLIDIPGERYPLFREPRGQSSPPINCLIIEANVKEEEKVQGFKTKDDKDLHLSPLKNVPLEVKWLENFLLQMKKADSLIGKIKVIRNETGEENFSEKVKNTLRNDSWHLVHYGGHSYYHGKKQRGYVFFPDRYLKAVSIEQFSMWIKDARFVFLSSCHSSEENFAFELAENGIPATLGFRWDIEDDLAEQYTETFYKELFLEKSLDSAFFKASQKMKEKHECEKIWAAPILVLQIAG